MPADPGRHRRVRLELERRIQAIGPDVDRLRDTPRERPVGPEFGAQRGAIGADIDDVPRPIEHGPMDRVRRQVLPQLVAAPHEREPTVPDPPGEWRHRVAAPPDRARPFRHQQLVARHDQRGEPAALSRIDRQRSVAGPQDHGLLDRPSARRLRHPAIVMARSGRSRKGGRKPGMFENGSTSGCRSMPSAFAMNARRRWIRSQASG